MTTVDRRTESVERRIEVPKQKEPQYGDIVITDDKVAEGKHRKFVGGRWDEIGPHQLEYMKECGLQPSHKFLDVGCGALRAGIHFVDYLDSGNYYGIDINHSLIEAGYNVEMTDEGRAKLPITNLAETDRFDAEFGVKFDYAIANSVFTHMSLNYIRLALARLAPVMASGGTFYATFFEQGDDFPIDGIFGKPPKRRFTERNVYWYYKDDMAWCASRLPFTAEYIGDWGHPRNQRMMRYTRD